jgi:hypothetical protein
MRQPIITAKGLRDAGFPLPEYIPDKASGPMPFDSYTLVMFPFVHRDAVEIHIKPFRLFWSDLPEREQAQDAAPALPGDLGSVPASESPAVAWTVIGDGAGERATVGDLYAEIYADGTWTLETTQPTPDFEVAKRRLERALAAA